MIRIAAGAGRTWASERPTDLRDLPVDAGVALLALSVHLKTGTSAFAPRRQRLLVTPATPLLAVTRLDAAPSEFVDYQSFENCLTTHSSVEGTRWGCNDTLTSPLSRRAFQTLHRLFPKTEWARRTKYWY